MGVIRFLLLVALIVVLIRIGKNWLRKRELQAQAKVLQKAEMVRCAQCGLFLPEADAIRAGDAFYCCDEHRRQAQGE